VGLLPVGQSLALTIVRDGEETTIDVVIEARSAQSLRGGELHAALGGAIIKPVPPELERQGLGYGVLVDAVDAGDAAWRNGLRSRDVITSVSRRRVESLDQFRRLVSASGELLLGVRRGGRAFFLAIR